MKIFLRLALVIGIISGLSLLGLLTWSTGNASRFAKYYNTLLVLNGVFALALIVWVLAVTVRLIRQVLRHEFGARLTARFALAFALIGVVPGVLIYTLSVQFMSRSIESWFNVRVESALEGGLALARAALDSLLTDLDLRAKAMVEDLNHVNDNELASVLTRLREANAIEQALIFTGGGRIIAFSTSEYAEMLPTLPPITVLNQLKISRNYSAIEADMQANAKINSSLQLRVVVPLFSVNKFDNLKNTRLEPHWLQLIQSVTPQIAHHADSVQQGFQDYQALAVSRLGLRKLYGITLTLALLLAVFSAIAVALSLSKRLARPLLQLAAGTQAVGSGDYRPLPETAGYDEVSVLTRSFNTMTRQLDEARFMVERNRRQVEQSNVYLENVLSNLSSGVLVFDEAFRVTMINQGAQSILHTDLRLVIGRPLETINSMLAFARHIRQAFSTHTAVGSERSHWQHQFEISLNFGTSELTVQSLTLLARGTHLKINGSNEGYLVVFDDITEVMSASRTVAWGEVARRLAHEIKNPLTPIQLSAERLAMKLADRLSWADAEMLKRSTNTIVNQVTSLKHMVDDFREFARTPPAVMQPVNFNNLIADVLTLYGWEPSKDSIHKTPQSGPWQVELADHLPLIQGDPTQLRQVIHNLLANARDAAANQTQPSVIQISTQLIHISKMNISKQCAVRFMIQDNGPGFTPAILQRAFEPYATTKTYGSGIGLAIVKKIIEEHGGQIEISNRREGGARISILLTHLPDDISMMDITAQNQNNAVTQ